MDIAIELALRTKHMLRAKEKDHLGPKTHIGAGEETLELPAAGAVGVGSRLFFIFEEVES